MMDCPVCHEQVPVADKDDIKAQIRTHRSWPIFIATVRLVLRRLVRGSW